MDDRTILLVTDNDIEFDGAGTEQRFDNLGKGD